MCFGHHHSAVAVWGKSRTCGESFWLGRMANAVVMACVVFKNSNDIIGDDREPSSIAREREGKRTGCVPNLLFFRTTTADTD